jgi:Fe-S-cluster containining protein
VSLGPHIVAERQLSDRDYYCRCRIDNTIFPAHVDPEYRDEVAGAFAAGGPGRNGTDNLPCLFLRKNPDGEGTACAIYATRPKVCRDFRCYRMVIRNREGIVLGKVIGKNTLRTEDPALEKLWAGQIAVIPYGDAAAWTEKVAGILAEHGYRAEAVG